MRLESREVKCPACGHVLSAATHIGGGDLKTAPVPEPDDVTFCVECLVPLQFVTGIANALGLKPLDWSVLDDDPETKADLEDCIRRMREVKER